MLERKKTGLLVSFEGIDASGKNTQSKMLFDYFAGKKLPSDLLSFPEYSTPIGQEIRKYLAGNQEYTPEARHLLYAANRYELKEKILDEVRGGKVVILNRYSESNFAYGVANGLPLKWLEELESLMPRSDIVFYLKISPEISAKRKNKDRDRFEADLAFLKRVAEVYDAFAADAGRWFTIDSTRRVDLVHYEIVKTLESVVPHLIQNSKSTSEPRVII